MYLKRLGVIVYLHCLFASVNVFNNFSISSSLSSLSILFYLNILSSVLNTSSICLCYIRVQKFGRWALALHHPVQVSQVFEASGRGKAASTRGTRYIALHPRHCAGFSVVRVSEMLHSRARRADDRTSGGEREGWWW